MSLLPYDNLQSVRSWKIKIFNTVRNGHPVRMKKKAATFFVGYFLFSIQNDEIRDYFSLRNVHIDSYPKVSLMNESLFYKCCSSHFKTHHYSTKWTHCNATLTDLTWDVFEVFIAHNTHQSFTRKHKKLNQCICT